MARPSSSSSAPDSDPDSTPPTTQQPTTFLASPSSSCPPLPAKSAPAPPRRRRRRVHRPAVNSLYDLIHEHAGTSLFVRPICWTDTHAQVLGARFDELPPCDTPLPTSVAGSPPSHGHMKPSQAITTLSDALTEMLMPSALHPVRTSNAVRTVLSTLWPDTFSKSQFIPEFSLFFGGRVYRDAVRAQVLWNFPAQGSRDSLSSFKSVSTCPADSFNISPVSSSTSGAGHNPANLPLMCYIGKSQLASIRKNLFRVAAGPSQGRNEPVYRLQQLRAKMLIPANSDHDAHFVGVFLAMAQRHFYGYPPMSPRRTSQWTPPKGMPARPQFEDIKLRILTHDTETAEFILYTGHITAKFLERFHDPFNTPSCDEEVPGLKIEYTKIPIWPILGLRERLGKALGMDVVGQFDPEDIETWEEGVDKSSTAGKRKREALSEVFNGSFDEDSDPEPAVTGKKRCLSEGSPVGVVV